MFSAKTEINEVVLDMELLEEYQAKMENKLEVNKLCCDRQELITGLNIKTFVLRAKNLSMLPTI